MCGCGHIPVAGFVGIVPGWLLSIAGFVLNKNSKLGWRIFIASMFVISSMILLKNIHNVLISGHEPVFKSL